MYVRLSKLYSLLGLGALFLLSTCTKIDDGNNKMLIVTTTGIIGDCISEIVGEKANVISIMGPGVDPHLYKASQGDLEKLARADVILYNGLHLEGKMGQVLKKAGKDKVILAMGDFAPTDRLKRVDKESELVDPHIWFHPDLWMNCLKGLVSQLNKVDGLQGIDSSYQIYNQKVRKSFDSLRISLDEALDQDSRILITSHDAFSYFGDAFGFEVRGLQGISTAAEFGIRDVADLIDFIIDNKVKSVFIETSVSDKNLRSVVEGAEARNNKLKIGGTLYSDALGESNGPAGSYIGMLEQNVSTIIMGLK